MDKLTTEHEVLDLALEAIHRETGLRMVVLERDVRKGDSNADVIVEIPKYGVLFATEIKKWAAQVNLGAIINQMNYLAEQGVRLFVADYINPRMATRLKEADIQFIDTAGNAYINHEPVYIYIKGNKPLQVATTKRNVKNDKAFQATGLKIVFAFLRNRELINAPYREIAHHAGVALGAVGGVIRDLVAQGFLLEGIAKNQRRLADPNLLFDKWVENYPHKLKDKHKIGEFTTDDPTWWKAINLKKFGAVWGGEIAAAKYTNYLNPKHGVVYIHKADAAKFLQAARLRKTGPQETPTIRIELIEPFWNEGNLNEFAKQEGLAHPIIAYADLIETGDKRNLDTAKRLHEEYLR